MKMPEISIVMPVYNCEDYLEETLSCVFNQTFGDFELICVDDGSTDSSLNILKEFADNDSRLKIISQENKGSGAARNRGLIESSGEYLFFIDSDDYIVPDFLDVCIKNISKTDCDFLMFQIASIRDGLMDGDVMFTPYHMNEKFIFNYEINKTSVINSYFAPWSKFYKKEFLEKYNILFDEDLPYEDVLFHVKSMIKASKILFIPECLYYYRIDSQNSLSSDSTTHIKIFDVVENVRKYLNEEGILDDFKMEFESFKTQQVIWHLNLPIDEEYFLKTKSYLKDVDCQNNTIMKNHFKEMYEIIYNCPSIEICQRNLKMARLENENRMLTNKRDYHKRKKEEIESSRSWRLTQSLRNLGRKFR